jgi:hypothetical protein
MDEKLQKLDMRSVLQTYLSCADIKKRISEFMKSRLLQPDMEQPMLPANEQCLLIYPNVTSYVALWWNLIGRHASAILDLMSCPLHSVNIWCSMNYVVTATRNSLLMGTLVSRIRISEITDLLYNIFTQQKAAFALERNRPCYVTKTERFRKEILELCGWGAPGTCLWNAYWGFVTWHGLFRNKM